MMTTLFLPLFVVLTLFQGPVVGPLAPRYACTGQEPDGTPYTAVLETQARGPISLLRWTMSQGGIVYGVALREGDLLVVSFRDEPGTITGVSIYRVTAGALEGRWTAFGATGIFREACLAAAAQQAQR